MDIPSLFSLGPRNHPVRASDGVAMLDPSQLKAYLLCVGCEKTLGVWEKYASKISLQANDSFPALALVSARGALESGDAYAEAMGLDCEVLTRFFVSIFWRASVSALIPNFSLDSEAEFGPYLRELSLPLPSCARLMVQLIHVSDGVRFDRGFTFPYVDGPRDGSFRLHSFTALGMHACLIVGKSLGDEFTQGCIAATRRVILSDGRNFLEGFRALAAKCEPRGELARLLERGRSNS
jgi:hypothetical protein